MKQLRVYDPSDPSHRDWAVRPQKHTISLLLRIDWPSTDEYGSQRRAKKNLNLPIDSS
jgi:hypothetical protein